jgi:hypothetical protein
MNEKNRNSDTKNIEPGNPKKINVFRSTAKNNFGQMKLRPPISVIRRVLKRRATESTNRKEFVESKA